jgi:DNA-binding response OmpR family regulator
MKKILIVEDDESLRQMYKQVFVNSGYAVDEAVDPNKSLELLKENSYNVILLDLLFPSMDGVDVVRTIKSDVTKNSTTPIIILTNLTHDKKIKKVMQLGAYKCLFKAEHTPKTIFKEVDAIIKDNNTNDDKEQNNE